MSLSFEDTKNQLVLSDKFTINGLFDLVKSVSGKVAGATNETIYLLNSGLMTDGTTPTATLSGKIQDFSFPRAVWECSNGAPRHTSSSHSHHTSTN